MAENNIDIADRITVVVTTSPTRSNPSIDVVKTVFDSFKKVQGVHECRKILVFDGYDIAKENQKTLFSSGRISLEEEVAYNQYKQNVMELIANDDSFKNTEALMLTERMGYSWALKAAMKFVNTPYVFSCQHDYAFTAQDIPTLDILNLMDQHKDLINYVGFMSGSNVTYLQQIESTVIKLNKQNIPFTLKFPDDKVPLVKLNFWFDKNHIGRVDYYRRIVVSDGRCIVRRGDFVEDRLGQLIRKRVAVGGDEAHSIFGTYWYHPMPATPALRHLDGRRYLADGQINEYHPKAIHRNISLVQFMNTQSKYDVITKHLRVVDEEYLKKNFKIHTISHRVDSNPKGTISEPDTQYLFESGIILPRVFILEYVGSCEQLTSILNEEHFQSQPISVHGIHGVPTDEDQSDPIMYTTEPSQDVQHLIKKLSTRDQDDEEYTFYILVQTFGKLAIPTKNLQSAFTKPTHIQIKSKL
ncbi:hypothetical protein AKO1_000836 [Acrasis kona]|uniref:Uncharacterized protein n=1 Tax=Acrasis kona TaxID=1008807 RepID=A0AAW2ZFN5_9EUKA